MQKIKNIVFIIIILLVWWVSQVIFSVLYSPAKDAHLGIGSGSWTNNITMTGFEKQQFLNFKNSIPKDITTWWLHDYNSKCTYWSGNCISFIGQDFSSAISWISTIQYIGKDVDISQPSDITNKFNTINNLNPKRWYPYLFAQYIWPSKKNDSNSDITKLTRENTIKIGEEGIDYQCDRNKINKIATLDYQKFLDAIADKNPEYRYPCKSDELAHALAFNYYHYMDNPIKSSLYYMVASFHDETPSITLSMPAIIQWREWNNKISAFLRYDKLHNHYKDLKKKEIPDDKRAKIEENIDTAMKKMVSEFSLHILTRASELWKSRKLSTNCTHSIACLKENNLISEIITQIKNTCKTDTISCEILSLWIQSEWIKNNWTLIYPVDLGMKYSWKEDKNIWWVKVK